MAGGCSLVSYPAILAAIAFLHNRLGINIQIIVVIGIERIGSQGLDGVAEKHFDGGCQLLAQHRIRIMARGNLIVIAYHFKCILSILKKISRAYSAKKATKAGSDSTIRHSSIFIRHFMKFHTSVASGQKNGQSDQIKNYRI